jgi:competence protein ComEC
VVAIAPHWLPLCPRPTPALHLFAVGHGQSCLVQHADHATAIDCGSLNAPFVAAERMARALGRRRLDVLVLTHGDHDHHNGVDDLLARVAIGSAIGPRSLASSPVAALLREHGTALRLLAPGERCTPAPHVTVWAPDLPATAGDNDQSLWVSTTVAGTRVLLPGDAQELGVAAALANDFATPHDLLVLPHHGRPNAAAPALLRAVQPRACFASASAADGDTTLGAIACGYGAELWVTGQHGSLRLAGADRRVFAELPGRPLAAPPRPLTIDR